MTKRGEGMADLYLCDPGKNSGCRGTVCFYDDSCLWHWCALTNDPACAVTGPDGEPVRVAYGSPMIYGDRMEPRGMLYADPETVAGEDE